MDMRSLIHQASSPRSSSSCSSDRTSVTATSSFPAPVVSSVLPAAHGTRMQPPPPTVFHPSAAPGAIAQAPTLVPLRFIIPNSRPSLAPVPLPPSSTSGMHEPEREPPHSMLYPLTVCTIKKEQQQDEPFSPINDPQQLKKSTSRRVRTPKLSSRSTKSKARPGLRKGKWTEEESRYASQLTHYFKEGLLPLERGTMLRLYLSQKLNCEPMRITKKFTGGGCIGKQVFRPCCPTPESQVRIMQAHLELVALEAAFVKRLKENREEPPLSTDEFDVRPVSAGQRSRPVPLKPRMYQSGDGDRVGDEDDANAVGLLLDFFYKANRKEKKGGKKAALTKEDESITMETKRKMMEEEEEQIKKVLIGIRMPTTPPVTNSENDALSESPTKRMRALSVSGCADTAAAKRSRVGSFSTVTAA